MMLADLSAVLSGLATSPLSTKRRAYRGLDMAISEAEDPPQKLALRLLMRWRNGIDADRAANRRDN